MNTLRGWLLLIGLAAGLGTGPCLPSAIGQVHVAYWAQDNGHQYLEQQDSLWETRVSVPASDPVAWVWVYVQAEAPNQRFDTVRIAFDTGPFGEPKPQIWLWGGIWYYTPWPTSWWYPRCWWSPADVVVVGRIPEQVLHARGDLVDLGVMRISVPAVPGEYKIDMLGEEYPYAPTRVQRAGQNLPTRTQDLVIVVRDE